MKKPRFFMVISGIIGTTTGVIISVLILIFLLGAVIAILVPHFSIAKKTPEQGVMATRTQRIVWGANNGPSNNTSESSNSNHLAENKPKSKKNPPGGGTGEITVTVVDSASSDGLSNIPIEVDQENNTSSVIAL